LVSRAVPQDELFSVIETIASNVNVADIVEYLKPSDAQAFIDVTGEVCHRAIPSLKNWLTDLCFNPLIPAG